MAQRHDLLLQRRLRWAFEEQGKRLEAVAFCARRFDLYQRQHEIDIVGLHMEACAHERLEEVVESLAIGQQWGQSMVPELIETLQARFKEEGIELEKQ